MQKITLLLIVIIPLVSSAGAATRYVSEDLYTYMHAGPGTEFKILGSVTAGTKIELIQTNKKAGFSKIKDSRGRNGWIKSRYISRQAGLKERLTKLEIEYADLNAQLNTAKDKADEDIANLENSLQSQTNQIHTLKNTNAKLNQELQEIQAYNVALHEKLDTKKNDLLMRWFGYGGMVGGAGLFLGLILPSLIPNRRKKTRW